MEKNEKIGSFPDHSQNFWHLASIQASSAGIPVMIVGGHIVKNHGIITGITSVILGNLMLWIIGITIISMSVPKKDNALQNIMQYLGKPGSISGAIFLILAFLSWYTLQLDSANIAISSLLFDNHISLRFGAAFGAFIALLSIGGIKLIKRYCIFIFPFIIIFAVFSSIFYFKLIQTPFVWSFSITGIFAVISINLAGMVNLPTFFRHSRSLGDSFLGLSLTVVFTMFFQIYMILIGYHSTSDISSNNLVYSYLLSLFIVLCTISVNLVNIYFALAGWEMIFPHQKTSKEFVIVGLLGTLAYTFIQITTTMKFILNMAENFIMSLGIVLLLSFLTKTFEQHRPRSYERAINFSCWFFGAIVGTLYTWRVNISSPKTLIVSFIATTLAYLFIIYIEEVTWSARKVFIERKHE